MLKCDISYRKHPAIKGLSNAALALFSKCQLKTWQNKMNYFYAFVQIRGITKNNVDRRIKSYVQWPFHSSSVNPRSLSEAGFYYLGYEDKTKCFYCAGGLQRWESTDDPFEEHAKWFPHCQFILNQKGFSFVKAVNGQHTNLVRPLSKKKWSVNSSWNFASRKQYCYKQFQPNL